MKTSNDSSNGLIPTVTAIAESWNFCDLRKYWIEVANQAVDQIRARSMEKVDPGGPFDIGVAVADKCHFCPGLACVRTLKEPQSVNVQSEGGVYELR